MSAPIVRVESRAAELARLHTLHELTTAHEDHRRKMDKTQNTNLFILVAVALSWIPAGFLMKSWMNQMVQKYPDFLGLLVCALVITVPVVGGLLCGFVARLRGYGKLEPTAYLHAIELREFADRELQKSTPHG